MEGEASSLRFNPMDHPLAFTQPVFLSNISAWVQHIPFAFALIDMCRPASIVELGTHKGDSYLAFCHAVATLGLTPRCTAIDTWSGDAHAGEYGAQVLGRLRQVHDASFGRFSTLLQSTFDDALRSFEDDSIELLHIDGFHSYDAVRHDYDTWLPKVSRKRGIILFHDTQVRDREFGVWRLWAEVSAGRPGFEFHHGSGLGVLGVGSELPDRFRRFLDVAGNDPASVRRYFEHMGTNTELLRLLRTMFDGVFGLQAVLDERQRRLGQAVEPAPFDEATKDPIAFVQRIRRGLVEAVKSELSLRGTPPSPKP